MIFLLNFIQLESLCGCCCFIKSPWNWEFRAQGKLTLAPVRCPYREVTISSNGEPEQCTELTKPSAKDQPLIFLCSNLCCLELWKLLILLMRKVIFFFIFSAERNDQTEQEERREIKQRLTRKVKSCSTFY